MPIKNILFLRLTNQQTASQSVVYQNLTSSKFAGKLVEYLNKNTKFSPFTTKTNQSVFESSSKYFVQELVRGRLLV
jgi:hypothetical protein